MLWEVEVVRRSEKRSRTVNMVCCCWCDDGNVCCVGSGSEGFIWLGFGSVEREKGVCLL